MIPHESFLMNRSSNELRISTDERVTMEEESSILKALFNDLTRTLFSSAIFLDDLHMNLNPESEVYDAWWLANEQLKRAIEFFLELRSNFFGSMGSS
jgi:hypothetical protein